MDKELLELFKQVSIISENELKRLDNIVLDIIKNNIKVAASAWTADTTYEGYPFKASISVTGCTANHAPDVSLSLEDVIAGNFAPSAETYAGGIYIYAKEKPTAEMTIPTILLTKVVN